MSIYHPSAMPDAVIENLNCRPGKIYVDGTLGAAGHARRICEKIAPHGLLIGIDRDPEMIINAQQILSPFSCRFHLFHDSFQNLPEILSQLHMPGVDGILLDLGISLHQLESSGRGFSFQKDEPLDMRMNPDASVTAESLVNTMERDGLASIFKTYGEERWARRIAKRIVENRRIKPIRTSKQLSDIVVSAIPVKPGVKQRIHPATRVFMAVRIAVNKELDTLSSFFDIALDCLNPGGRLCVLSFHSLEDRIVKQRMKAWAAGCTCSRVIPVCICEKKPMVRLVHRKALRPASPEVAKNPLSRSTRLRVVEKLS
jgi:16S rRNA (cytosine1402-N4)-methyltransferase